MKSRKFVFVLGLLLAACCDCSWGMSSFPPKNPLDQQEGGEIQHPKRNMFTPEEDRLLREHVKVMGTKDWKGIAQQMSGRNARQCRERWKNYLAPGLNLGLWTKDEDQILLVKHKEFGSKWKKISCFLPGRSMLNVQNRWRYHVKNQGDFDDF